MSGDNLRVKLALAASAISLALLSGCPGGQQAGSTNPPATSQQTAASTPQPGTNRKFPAPGNPPSADKPPAPPPTAPPDEPNPRPTAAPSVFTAQLHHHVGEKLQVEYQLTASNGGKAWVALVPESVQDKDEPTNSSADYSSSPTVDAASATLNLDLPKAGRFRLRLFESKELSAKLLAESPVLTVDQWPLGDLTKQVPPYVTINAPKNISKVEVQQSFPVVAYFEVPPGYDDKAWIGVVPVDTKSPQEFDNDKAAVPGAVMYLSGKTKDSYTWKDTQLGTYVFRIFPSSAPQCDYVAQSEPFTIIPKGTPPGK